jgi:leucyl aminopeptidase
MATSNGRKPTRARARRQTTQTIAEIELRAAEIEHAEREAMTELVAFIRELMCTLPPESAFPLRFARAADNIEQFNDAAFDWGASVQAGWLDHITRDD